MDSSDAFAAFGEPPAPPWDPNTGPIDDSNPYGFWDGRAGNLTSPMCRKTEPLYLCSLCGDNTPEDPSGFLRAVVIFDHLLMFVGPIWVAWEVFQKKDVLNKRVYSPFLLLFGASIMQGKYYCMNPIQIRYEQWLLAQYLALTIFTSSARSLQRVRWQKLPLIYSL